MKGASKREDNGTRKAFTITPKDLVLSGGPAYRHMLKIRDGRRALKRAVRRGMAAVVREAGL